MTGSYELVVYECPDVDLGEPRLHLSDDCHIYRTFEFEGEAGKLIRALSGIPMHNSLFYEGDKGKDERRCCALDSEGIQCFNFTAKISGRCNFHGDTTKFPDTQDYQPKLPNLTMSLIMSSQNGPQDFPETHEFTCEEPVETKKGLSNTVEGFRCEPVEVLDGCIMFRVTQKGIFCDTAHDWLTDRATNIKLDLGNNVIVRFFSRHRNRSVCLIKPKEELSREKLQGSLAL